MSTSNKQNSSPVHGRATGRFARGVILLLCLPVFGPVLFGQEAAAVEEEAAGKNLEEKQEGRYRGIGKRDPFMSLLTIREEDRTKVVPPPPLEERPPGLPGLLISEVSVSGVATGNAKEIIVLKGIDGVSYIAEPGSELFDGFLKEVNNEGVIFSRTEQTTDGKSKTFKVTKPFNSSEKQVLP